MIATQLASQSAIIDHVTRISFQLATEETCWTVLSQNLIRIICLEPKLFQRVILEVRPIRWTGFACEILVYAWWSLDLWLRFLMEGVPSTFKRRTSETFLS